MRLAVFGATGMVGKAVTKAALDEGHEVVALVRSPEKLESLASRITLIPGDYFDPHAQCATLNNADAVLSTIGPPMKRGPNNGEYTHAMEQLIEAMRANSVNRIIAIGGAGLRLGDEKLGMARGIMRQILRWRGGPDYFDKEAEHNALFQSGLDWTILRPPQIGFASGEFTSTVNKVAGFKVDARQLASHMVEILNDRNSFQTAPFVATV